MKYLRPFISLFVALCVSFAPTQGFAVLKGSGGQNPAAVSITGGTIADVTLTRPVGVEYKLAHAAIPVGLAPTGTMANNGAVTLGTALNTTYAACYLYYPAGAVAAGVPASADFLYTVMSSTTVGQVFNNSMSANLDTNGMPTAPASPTAFATTGPGAFTGTTGSAITLYTLTVPAAAMGTNGLYRYAFKVALNATAGGRTFLTSFGGTTINNPSLGNVVGQRIYGWVENRNSASVQNMWQEQFTTSSVAAAAAYAAVNTGGAVTVLATMNRAVATDTFMVETASEWITNQ